MWSFATISWTGYFSACGRRKVYLCWEFPSLLICTLGSYDFSGNKMRKSQTAVFRVYKQRGLYAERVCCIWIVGIGEARNCLFVSPEPVWTGIIQFDLAECHLPEAVCELCFLLLPNFYRAGGGRAGREPAGFQPCDKQESCGLHCGGRDVLTNAKWNGSQLTRICYWEGGILDNSNDERGIQK